MAFPTPLRVLDLFCRAVGKMLTRAICRWAPGVVRRILVQRRLSFWYKTTQGEAEQRAWGYVDRHSIEAGGSFRVMLSAGPGVGSVRGYLEVYRIGFYATGDRDQIWQSEELTIAEHEICNTAASLGPNWPVAITVDHTEGWKSGYHSIDFVHADGAREQDVAFLVVTATTTPASKGVDILVKLATSTYQAYNRWGGHNLYPYETPSAYQGQGLTIFESDIVVNRGGMVAFDRPTPSEFFEWEYSFVLWLEELAQEEGLSVAYTTNFDFAHGESGPESRLLISVGHDEYWSKEEFDRHYDRIFERGGNTLFLGSNIAYWQVRYVDANAPDHSRGRQLVCHKSMIDPIRFTGVDDPELHVTARFRDGARRPESMLMGVAYQSNLTFRHQVQPRTSFRVVDADLPFFEGTGLVKGQSVGDLVGHEWDNRDPESEFSAPGEEAVEATERLWHEGRSKIPLLPLDRLRVVFEGEVADVFGRKGRAESVYFESDAGAKVFSAGINRWSWGLGKDGYIHEPFRRLNRNLVLDFLAE